MSLMQKLKLFPSPARAHLDAVEEAAAGLLSSALPRYASTPQRLAEHRNHLDEQLESGQLRGTPAQDAVRAQRDACDSLKPVLQLQCRIGEARQQIAQDRERFERDKAEAGKEVKRAESALSTAQRAAVQPAQRLRTIDEALERQRSRAESEIAAAGAALDEALLTGEVDADVAAAAGLLELRRKLADDLALLEQRRASAAKVHEAQAAIVRDAESRLAAARTAEAAAAVQLAQLEADATAGEFVAGLLAVVREAQSARNVGEQRESDRARHLAALRVVVFDSRRAWYGPQPDANSTAIVVQPYEQLVLLARLLDGPPLDLQALSEGVPPLSLPVAA